MESYADLGRERQYISEDRPNFTLKIDVEEMSADERSQAVETLKYASEILKDTKKSVREMVGAGG